jgi:hypothetical protein
MTKTKTTMRVATPFIHHYLFFLTLLLGPLSSSTKTTTSAFLLLPTSSSCHPEISRFSSCLNAVGDREKEDILNKVRRALQDDDTEALLQVDYSQFESYVRSLFPGALTNPDFELGVFEVLHAKGFVASNTLLATSLCSDEVAKRLSDDFAKIYGTNFHLGGLAGFPFAGNTGFDTMAGHIPDDGFCLLLYGPHIGVCRDGMVGRVERDGVALIDECCRSSIEAFHYLLSKNAGAGAAAEDSNTNNTGGGTMAAFTDMQQTAVQNLLEPFVANRLAASEYPLVELSYALYEFQDEFVREIVKGVPTISREAWPCWEAFKSIPVRVYRITFIHFAPTTWIVKTIMVRRKPSWRICCPI